MLFEVGEVIRELEDGVFANLARAIDSLAYAPRREDAEELPEGFWLLRSGDFSLVYVIDDESLTVRVVYLGRQPD